jgi:enoyl-CoA hydratase/carnithine racemase
LEPASFLSHLPASVRFEREDDVAIVRLARTEKRNALNDETVRGLETVFGHLPSDVRAVVLTAVGPHFSAGLDLSSLTESTVMESMERSHLWYRAFDLIQYGNVPVIAALHGAVIGGGLELASAAHIRVADRSAFYALPEAQRGIFVGGGGSVRISRLIGPHRMMDLMLTGRVYSADEGQHIGISQYLVDEGEATAQALAIAHQTAQTPPLSIFGILHAVPRNAEADPATGYVLEGLMAAVAAGDPAAKTRIADFLAGRAAKVQRS